MPLTKKHIINYLKNIGFLAVGILIFWLIYNKLELERLKNDLQNLHYGWIILSIFIGLLSHFSRAYRWKMLIKTLGYKPGTANTFLSVLVMYLINLLLPRVGEIGRCSILKKYEGIPFSKLVGTVVIERTTDMLAMIFFAITIIIIQFPVFRSFLAEHPAVQTKLQSVFSTQNILIGIGIIAVLVFIIYMFGKHHHRLGISEKFKELWHNFVSGIKSIRQLQQSWKYIAHTVFIYLMWLVMLYIVFFSYEPTEHLSILAGWAAFVMSGLAMAAPVQAGIGAWHFMVYNTLYIYGVDITNGKIFALIAHTATNGSLLIFGLIALYMLPLINKNKSKTSILSDVEESIGGDSKEKV